jgi:hypothetical protein
MRAPGGSGAFLALALSLFSAWRGCVRVHHAATGNTMVDVEARDYAFALPESIGAGLVTFRVRNSGTVLHQMNVYELLPDARLDSTLAVLRANLRRPDHVLKRGGVEFVPPGQVRSIAMVLAPGEYVLLCGLPMPGGAMTHMNAGMIQPLHVVASNASRHGAAHSLPAADDTLELTEYDFRFSHPLRAGTQTVLVENVGAQPHHWELARVAPTATMAQIDAYDGHGPEPWTNVGGVGVLDPGQSGRVLLTLPAGSYLHSCMIADAKDGKPHFMHGMEKITVVK